jgi:hypothetical protein
MTAPPPYVSVARVIRPVLLAVAFGFALAACGSPAVAQEEGASSDPRIAARALGYAGVEAYQVGDYAAADLKLQRAFALLPAPSLGLWSARALVKLGRLVEASERYKEVVLLVVAAGDTTIQKHAQAEAADEREALLRRIPSVTLRLKDGNWAGVIVAIDGAPIAATAVAKPILANPGKRMIEARRTTGARSVQGSTARVVVELSEAEHASVVLEFGDQNPPTKVETPALLGLDAAGDDLPAPRQPDSDSDNSDVWRTGGWVSAGIGGSLLVASGISGLVAWSKLDDFDCSRDPCQSPNRDDVDTYGSLRSFSTIGYVAGGVLLAAGLFVLYEYREPESDLSLKLGASSATLEGRF